MEWLQKGSVSAQTLSTSSLLVLDELVRIGRMIARLLRLVRGLREVVAFCLRFVLEGMLI